MPNDVKDRFNMAAIELQATEFRLPKTPNEWKTMAKNPPKRDFKKLLDAVMPFIGFFEDATPSERALVSSELNPEALGTLRIFSNQAAVQAVRKQEPTLITHGLAAVAVLGKIDDVRDLIISLAVLYHCAVKLDVDAVKLFDSSASWATSTDLEDAMRQFPLRPPQHRELGAFFLRETTTDEGFDVNQDRPS